jgi:hypothetical protein
LKRETDQEHHLSPHRRVPAKRRSTERETEMESDGGMMWKLLTASLMEEYLRHQEVGTEEFQSI